MNGARVHIVATGVANIASVAAAFSRLGADAALTDSPRDVERARALVLPGVGSFAAGMQRLRNARLVEPLRDRLARGDATLAICLGMQMLCGGSEEAPGVAGIGVYDAALARFPRDVRTPLIGWSRIEASPSCALMQSDAAYFAHSYRLTTAPAGWSAAWAEHGGRFVAAMENGSVLACQFHPELSGEYGEALLERWLARAAAAREGAAP